MKKIFICLLTVILSISLYGCKEKDDMQNDEWVINENVGIQVEENALETLEKAQEGYAGAGFEYIACIGKQIVAGTKYIVLVKENLVTATPETKLAIVTVYGNGENYEISNLSQLDLDELETSKTSPINTEGQDGGPKAFFDLEPGKIDKEVSDAFLNATGDLLGGKYEAYGLLATKKGTNTKYALLVKETIVAKNMFSNYAIVFVEVKEDGTVVLNNVFNLNLGEYN